MEKSLGQHLQNWLIRNKMEVTDPMFVDSVDHTIENAIRDYVAKTKQRVRSGVGAGGGSGVDRIMAQGNEELRDG
jgi:hypothetical protein